MRLRATSFALGAAVLSGGCTAQSGFAANAGTVALVAHSALRSIVPTQRGDGRIRHVVIIVQENRSVDDLFHGLPGADVADSGLDSEYRSIPLRPTSLKTRFDISHTHGAFLTEYHRGQMNGFDHVALICGRTQCPQPGLPAYAYVPPAEVQPYFQMAETYTFADRMFQTNAGPSFPAHQYLLSGTSLASVTSPLLAAENAHTKTGATTGGCDSPAGSSVYLIDPVSGIENTTTYPCFEHPVLVDLLDRHRLTWRYYQPRVYAGLWDAPDAIRHIRYSADYANVISPGTKFLTDIASEPLAAVTWIIPNAAQSDHAGITDGSGPSWVADVVNAIGESPYWNSTAIFITWDDWGGWYDHVPPERYNAYELGFRVPLIVISPFAKRAYVSHAQHEFGSILRFTEEVFGLGSLGYSDARADDLSDCFDFNAAPSPFQPIAAPLPASYFEHLPPDHRSPDDD